MVPGSDVGTPNARLAWFGESGSVPSICGMSVMATSKCIPVASVA